MSNPLHSLPACQKCKSRKVRCDRAAPKCGHCTKGSVACIIVDPVTGEQYARDYIQRLEDEEKRLIAILNNAEIVSGDARPSPNVVADTPQGPLTAASAESRGGFVGDGSGVGFLHRILSEADWQHHRERILTQLSSRPGIAKDHLTPNQLPSVHEANQLLENYFTRFHIHHTFLLRQEVLDIFNRVYNPHTGSPSSEARAQDLYRLLMVFAISSTTRYRAGLSLDHPYGYFTAAEAYLSRIRIIRDPDAVQNLLLVARFGMYHHIGTSLWEISQLCMRQCIEWRLHTRPTEKLPPLVEQHRRRIFWECYVLDRYSSGFLGRPFAIRDSDIDVLLPINCNDEDIIQAGIGHLDHILAPPSTRVTELSVFIFCIELRRISSRVHSTFYEGRQAVPSSGSSIPRNARLPSVGHVYTAFSKFSSELDRWRAGAPVFQNPRSLYERSEWHDFLLEKDLLLLARGAMHNMPLGSQSKGSVTKRILKVCYTSASRVIQIYSDLMRAQAITWTRSYFQIIFTAGLTVTFCLGLDVIMLGTDADAERRSAYNTLTLCKDILAHFKEKMPDAGAFATVFNLLRDGCTKERLGLDLQHESHFRDGDGSLHPDMLPQQGIVDPRDGLSNMSESYPGDLNEHSGLSQSHDLDGWSYDHHALALGLNDNVIAQLEGGLGEYAWGSLVLDNNLFDSFC